MDWVVVDLDGTITDCSHRVHLAQAGLWEEFNAACTEDRLRLDVALVLSSLEKDYEIMIVTGRDNKHRKITWDWLASHGISAQIILMRPSGDFRPDAEVKIGLLETFFGNKAAVLNSVMLCLDDREKVVEALRNYGLKCWQVRQGDY